MADLISKSALLDDIDGAVILSGKHEDILLQRHGALKVLDRINAAPTVDAVEVVRCKDCKSFKSCKEIEGVSWTGYCNYGEFHTDEDDFCSRGERRANV